MSAGAHNHWLYRASHWQVLAVAALCGVVLWLLLVSTDAIVVLSHDQLGVVAMGMVDALVAIFIALLIFKVLLAMRARHQRVIRDLKMIAEMNHHIRNALERIEYAVELTHNKELIEHMHQSSSRIEWTLRELLPKSEGD